MGFVNERMTKEERVEFSTKAIPNPGNKFFTLEPTKWTVNREEDVYFVWALQEREEPNNYYFLLGWKGTPLPVKLRKTWVDNYTCKWELIYIKITEDLVEKRGEIIQSLKDALTAYGYNGNPEEPSNNTTKVEFTF